MNQDIWRISKSLWSSPLPIVSKSSGSIHPVGKYPLYSIIIPYTIHTIFPINGKKISKLDIIQECFRKSVHLIAIENCCMHPIWTIFEFSYLNFRLCGAAQTFQGLWMRYLATLNFAMFNWMKTSSKIMNN